MPKSCLEKQPLTFFVRSGDAGSTRLDDFDSDRSRRTSYMEHDHRYTEYRVQDFAIGKTSAQTCHQYAVSFINIFNIKNGQRLRSILPLLCVVVSTFLP